MKYQNDTSHNSTGLATVWPQDFMQDLRYGWRILRRTPGFALVAVLTIALGIGASSAVFTVINTFFLNSIRIFGSGFGLSSDFVFINRDGDRFNKKYQN